MISSNLSPAEVTRYARQMALDGWGREAQEKLKTSRVLIAGAGGLASSVALYLLATGVGSIRLVDQSRVTLTDLNHQILYRERDLGKSKAAIAERRLKDINPFCLVEGQSKTISEHNVSRLASGCDLMIDAMNSASAGHLLNQAAVKFRIPLIHAWVWEMQGRLSTFWPGQGPCLACAFPEASTEAKPALLGPLPGILGALQSLEALRILGGLGPALLGRLLSFRGDQFMFTEKPIKPNPHCLVCRRLSP
jgi:adenylyltransferase/sulfurtransferase